MAIDLTALDEKIRKLQLIRQLASDPDLSKLLQDVIVGNGSAAPPVWKPPAAERKGVRYDVLGYVPSCDPSDSSSSDSSSDAGVALTAKEIAEKMEEAKYKFKSKDHITTVRESLRELEKERLVEKAGTNSEDGAAMWRKTS